MAGNAMHIINTVDRLTGENYHTWKFRMRLILKEQGLNDMIENEFNAENFEQAADLNAARRRDSKCMNIITQCIESSQIEIIRNQRTAYGMWSALEQMYERKGLPGQLFLKRKLFSMRLKEGENMETFLRQFDDTKNKLEAAGGELKEQDVICSLLLALPKSYETVVAVLENKEDVTLDFVKAKLKEEAEKKLVESDDFTPSTAFISNTPRNCWKCGKQGHFKRNCFTNAPQNQGTSVNWRGRGRGSYRRPYRGNNRAWKTRGNYVEMNQDDNEEKEICFMANNVTQSNDCDVSNEKILFYIDSGCTDHLVKDKNVFENLILLKTPIQIAIAKDGQFLEATGVGNIMCSSQVNKDNTPLKIKNALYVPKLRKNLLSVKRLENSGIKIVFENAEVKLYKREKLIGKGKCGNLYEIGFNLAKLQCNRAEKKNESYQLWHRRYGHIGHSNLKRLVKENLVEGCKNVNIDAAEFCEDCVKGKMTRLKFTERTRAKRLLEIVHSDVCGPITPTSYDGKRYFVTFIDDFSNFVCVYIIERKDQVIECFREYINMTQTKFNRKLENLRCDNGREYCSNDFRKLCKDNGTTIDYTVPYTPQQNGKSERFNRSIVEKTRSMLSESNISKTFWNEAVRTAVYIINRSPSASLENKKTPAEVWYGRKPDVSNMRVFGCSAWAHIPKQLRRKLDFKATNCIFLGYMNNGYRLWDVKDKKVIISRDVVFNEKLNKKRDQEIIINEDEENVHIENINVMDNNLNEQDEPQHNRDNDGENNNNNENRNVLGQNNNIQGRPKRGIKPPERFRDYVMYMALDAMSYVEQTPQSFEELNKRDDCKNWLSAVENEIQAIEFNETWTPVIKPKGKEILDTKWVFSFKPWEVEMKDKYKARLVVRGFAQRKTFEYDEIYSPVAKMTTIRTVLIVANQCGHYINQMDVKSAFLHGEVKDDIYIYPPDGICCDKDRVLKLRKAIYGLKQSSKCWNEKINTFLVQYGFVRSENDYCLYSKKNKKGYIYIVIYVDDIILSGLDKEEIDRCKSDLMNEFKMKDKGQIKNFLGLEIEYDKIEGIMKLGQKKYAESILRRFKFDNCKEVTTPMEQKLSLLINIEKKEKIDCPNKPIRELVGCLMYLMLGTRPDLSYSVNYLSRYQDVAKEEVWTYAKRILRYIKGTVDIGLYYKREKNAIPLISFVDADWATDPNGRRSTSGFLIKVFDNTVAWITRRQNCVALSTTEAELISFCSAVQELCWYKKLLNDININTNQIVIYEDNQGCIALIKSPENNRRVKHIDLKFNYVCESLKSKNIIIKYIDTKNQQADILTKGLSSAQFIKIRKELGLNII